MTAFELFLLVTYAMFTGFLVGYIFWAPDTPFKCGLVKVLSLHFIWGRFFK